MGRVSVWVTVVWVVSEESRWGIEPGSMGWCYVHVCCESGLIV